MNITLVILTLVVLATAVQQSYADTESPTIQYTLGTEITIPVGSNWSDYSGIVINDDTPNFYPPISYGGIDMENCKSSVACFSYLVVHFPDARVAPLNFTDTIGSYFISIIIIIDSAGNSLVDDVTDFRINVVERDSPNITERRPFEIQGRLPPGYIVSGTSPDQDDVQPPSEKKYGDESHLKAPVFGRSLINNSHQLVDYGFYHNDKRYTITDNWHADVTNLYIPKGIPQTFALKVYSHYPIEFAQLCFTPHIGGLHNAEMCIRTALNPYDVTEKVTVGYQSPKYTQPLLTNVNDIKTSIYKDACTSADTTPVFYKCTYIEWSGVQFADIPHFEKIAINVYDTRRLSQTTYLNEANVE